jgi:beta-mannanase
MKIKYPAMRSFFPWNSLSWFNEAKGTIIKHPSKGIYLGCFILVIAILSCKVQEGKIADPKATVETRQLFNNLMKIPSKGIMFGHSDDLAYGHSWKYISGKSDVKSTCSDYPAVYSWDLGKMEYGSAYNLDSVPFDSIRQYVRRIYKWGGLNTFSWHADNPLTGENAWDVANPGTVNSILPGCEKHELYKQWLDHLASFFLSLKDDRGNLIPVIFRPFHEHSGNWFWWGHKNCTTDEYIRLWRFTVEYLRDTKNIHNLIYAYSNTDGFVNEQEYLERYPGDDYVDLLGFDAYQFGNVNNSDFTSHVSQKLELLTDIAKKKNKLAALTESGFEQIPYATWWTDVLWEAIKNQKIAYVLIWRNAHNKPNHYYVPFPGQVSEKDFVDFYNLPQTLFLKDIEGCLYK